MHGCRGWSTVDGSPHRTVAAMVDARPGGEFEAGRRLDAEAGYGFRLAQGRGVLTPFPGLSLERRARGRVAHRRALGARSLGQPRA